VCYEDREGGVIFLKWGGGRDMRGVVYAGILLDMHQTQLS
jgi:hypothetical protein